MTRYIPLILLALAVVALIAYARLEREADREWQSVMDAIPRKMRAAR